MVFKNISFSSAAMCPQLPIIWNQLKPWTHSMSLSPELGGGKALPRSPKFPQRGWQDPPQPGWEQASPGPTPKVKAYGNTCSFLVENRDTSKPLGYEFLSVLSQGIHSSSSFISSQCQFITHVNAGILNDRREIQWK